MRRRRLLSRCGIAVLLAGSLLTTVQSSQADEWYPGLPDATFGAWSTTPQSSMSYAKRAKQWFISPSGMAVAEFINENDPDDYGKSWIRAEGYFVSPKGAPANYGYLEPMTVRSVGFGMIPVEATVQVSQRRANGYPLPVRVRLETHNVYTPIPGRLKRDMTALPTTISDSFNVQILSVKVDGVDLELNGTCRTAEPAPVLITSPEYFIEDHDRTPDYNLEWYRSRDPETYYEPTKGGQLTGSMTIPPFTGCTTKSGDDLSDLMTLSVSGPDNPVAARTGWYCEFKVNGVNAPAPPGVTTPQLGTEAGGGLNNKPGCPGVKSFQYPARDDR